MERRRLFSGSLILTCFLIFFATPSRAQYHGIWKDDATGNTHNFYIQHYSTGSTVIIYTKDANTFFAFLADIVETGFSAPSMDPAAARYLEIEFHSPNHGSAVLADATQEPPMSMEFGIGKQFAATRTEHSGIWKDAENVFNMYVQEYETGSAVIVYTFDGATFRAFLGHIEEGMFGAQNLGEPAEQLQAHFLGPETGFVQVTPIESVTEPQAYLRSAPFAFDVLKRFAPPSPEEPEAAVVSGFIYMIQAVDEPTGVPGVTVQFGDLGSTTTDELGWYYMEVPLHWSGNATPSKQGCVFDPPYYSFSDVTSDLPDRDFEVLSGNGSTFVALSGTVRVGSPPVPLPGVAIDLSGDGVSAITDTLGAYSIVVPSGWEGTITPTLTGHTFDPASIPLGGVTEERTDLDFWAPQPADPYVSGAVYALDVFLGTIPQLGVTVSFSGLGSVTTNSQGTYSKQVPYAWSGTVTPSVVACTFNPPTRTYSTVRFDLPDEDFQTFCTGDRLVAVSGMVTDKNNGAPIAGVTLSFGSSGSTSTDASGAYSFSVGLGWSGTVTPIKPGCPWPDCRFDPPSRTYSNLTADQTGQNYTLTRDFITISGTVTADIGLPLREVTLSTRSESETTDNGGFYSIRLHYGIPVTVKPSKQDFSFTPPERHYSDTTKDWTNQNFLATCTGPSCAYR